MKGTEVPTTRENPDKMIFRNISLSRTTAKRVRSVGCGEGYRQQVTYLKHKDSIARWRKTPVTANEQSMMLDFKTTIANANLIHQNTRMD